MTAPTLVEFEQAVIARLETRKQSPALPDGELRLVEPYEGQFEDWIEDRVFDSPAVVVLVSEGRDEPKTMRTVKRTVQLQVFVAVMNYRGQKEARQGVSAAAEVGVYGLIELVYDLLTGQTLGLEMKPLQSGEWGSLTPPESAQGFPFSLYRYEFTTSWTKDWPDDALGDEARGPAADLVPDHVTSQIVTDGNGDDTPDLTFQVTHEES